MCYLPDCSRRTANRFCKYLFILRNLCSNSDRPYIPSTSWIWTYWGCGTGSPLLKKFSSANAFQSAAARVSLVGSRIRASARNVGWYCRGVGRWQGCLKMSSKNKFSFECRNICDQLLENDFSFSIRLSSCRNRSSPSGYKLQLITRSGWNEWLGNWDRG